MQSFNAMVRQLDDARASVDRNRAALVAANTYLESILSNLSAGVLVFDDGFRLVTANDGAAQASSRRRSPRGSATRLFVTEADDTITSTGRRQPACARDRDRGELRGSGDRRHRLAAPDRARSRPRRRPARHPRARLALPGRQRRRPTRRLSRRVRRHDRRDLGAALGRLGRGRAPTRARDQEPADPDPAVGRAPEDEARRARRRRARPRCSSAAWRRSSTRCRR